MINRGNQELVLQVMVLMVLIPIWVGKVYLRNQEDSRMII